MITCEFIESGLVRVNDKSVHLDMSGNWIGANLNLYEAEAFRMFLKMWKISGGRLQKSEFSFKKS